MSEHALAFGKEDLSHRLLILYELAALNSDYGSYLLRSLLSEGKISYEVVTKSKDGLTCELWRDPGLQAAF